MSHFNVLVIGEDVDGMLAPYCEQDEEYCTEFEDAEDSWLEQYESETTTWIVMPDGRLLLPRDDEFRVPGTFGWCSDGSTHKPPEHLERREVPFRETFPTFEDFMREWCGFAGRDPETGRYGTRSNPNAKWDWWTVGGRFRGFFAQKDGGLADQSRKSDVDWERMRSIFRSRAEAVWAEAAGEDVKTRRSLYGIHEGEGREEYVERRSQVGTFAVLTSEGWHERGRMGWWACVFDEKPHGEWLSEWQQIVDAAPDDALLTIVDCHI